MAHQKARDWTPNEIRKALIDGYGHGAQSAIARELNVTPSAVFHTIEGGSMDRIRRTIARYARTDVKVIWPSVYLYGDGPRNVGRPKAKPLSS